MTHSYTVNNDLYAIILNNDEEVGRHGPWGNAEEAEAWGKMISDCYNDKTQNPKERIYPTSFILDQLEDEPIIIPNEQQAIGSTPTA